jgi:hypothetical protein
MLRQTVSQSVSMSWCQVHSGTCDQILLSVWKLLCCQSQSCITTNSQSASLSWCQAPIWDPRPIFLPSLIIFRQLRDCWCGVPSLMGSLVCSFQFLLGIVSTAFLRSESHTTHEHILSLFLRLPQPGGLSSCIYIPQAQGSPDIPPGTGLSSQSQSQSHIATDSQSVSMSWCRAQIWDFWPEIIYLFFWKLQSCHFWGAFSDERSGLSCVSICLWSLQGIGLSLWSYTYNCEADKIENITSPILLHVFTMPYPSNAVCHYMASGSTSRKHDPLFCNGSPSQFRDSGPWLSCHNKLKLFKAIFADCHRLFSVEEYMFKNILIGIISIW